MRATFILWMILAYGHWWLYQILVVALAWDLWEAFYAPRPAIIVTKPAQTLYAPQPSAIPGLPDKLAELLAARTKCAEDNNCEDCKKFVAQFMGAPEPPVTEPVKACTSYEPKGYL